MRIFMAADHGGYQLKEELKKYLTAKGYQLEDMGAHGSDPEDDYPDFVFPLALRVASANMADRQDKQDLGIVIGRSGSGEAIAANKVKGIRAVVCVNPEMARLAREKNNANILSLGADFLDKEAAKEVAETFLTTPFSKEERHAQRLKKISDYESH